MKSVIDCPSQSAERTWPLRVSNDLHVFGLSEKEFAALGDKYPTGEYRRGQEAEWFEVKIDEFNMKLVWYK